MLLAEALLGRPLASSETKKEQLTVWTGVPVLGLDALASSYGPEAALTVLATVGAIGLHYYLPIRRKTYAWLLRRSVIWA
jgi:hypothetical protein